MAARRTAIAAWPHVNKAAPAPAVEATRTRVGKRLGPIHKQVAMVVAVRQRPAPEAVDDDGGLKGV